MKDKRSEKIIKRSVVLSCWLVYLFTFPTSYQASGFSAAVLGIIPVSATAWVFGVKWGFIAGILNTPTTMVLHHISAGSISGEPMPAYILGTAVIVVGGLFIGRMSDVSRDLSAELHRREKAEGELRQRSVEAEQQKQYYQTLVDSSPIAIVSLTPEQKVKSCNQSFEKLFGYDEEEIIGQDIDKLVAGDGDLAQAAEISKTVQSGTTVQASGKRITKSGKILDVDIYGVPVIVNGKPEGILGQYVNVTDKKLVESALQEHIQFLQTIIDVIPTPVSYKSTGGLYLGCNTAFEASVGISRDEIQGRSVYDIYPRESADFISELDKKLLEHPGIQRLETQVIYPDNSLRDILLNRATFNDIHGNLAGVISARLDISDIMQTERELRESEARFRSLFEYAPDAVIILNTTGTILSWNPAAENIFGYSVGEVQGKNVDKFLPQSKLDDYLGKLMRLNATGKSELSGNSIEVEGKRKDGEVIPIEISLSQWQVEKENFISVIVRDISYRKRVENELRVAKATAEEAAQVKTKFLTNMSHEIRTPLNAVLGMTGLLLNTQLTIDQQDYVETIRLSGDSLLEVINYILDFSKVEAGKVDMETQPFNLRTCVESALDLVVLDAVQKELNLAYIIGNSTPNKIIGDETRLRQILVNLLANALKFTDEGEVTVAVCSNQISENKFELHFSVRDTGIGISPEGIELLFQSFSQVDSSSKRKYGGTGLGLAISKTLVEAMGGEIHVESEKGKGSVFSFWIVVETTPETSPLFPVGEQPDLQKKRILILDGNLTNLRIIAQHAQSWGMEPHAFQSSEEILNNLRAGEKYDVAILDCHNCQTSNEHEPNLVEEIRLIHNADVLPILILRTLGSKAGRDLDAHALVNGFLTKPIKPAILFDLLMKVFQKEPTPIKEIAGPEVFDKELGQKHPLKILLAEDNPVNQKVAKKILEQIGYRPDIASNGFDVIHALERQFYDLILLDIQMPEMDGEQAAHIIRNNHLHTRQPRIVALTAHALEGDRERYLAAGMDDFISKPVRIEKLMKVLEETPLLHMSSIGDNNSAEVSET